MGAWIGLWMMAAAATPAAQAADQGKTAAMPVGSSPTQGPAGALVTIVQFSEFQCPFCSRVRPALEEIRKEYGDRVRLVFKHNPLPFHRDAWPAATAAIAAEEQGKFWQMHDKLFDNQRALGRQALDGYALELGLNMAKFAQAMTKQPYDARIKAEQAMAARYGARGTPAFFINGVKLMGAQPFSSFKKVIDDELTAAQAMQAKGLKPAAIYAKRCAVNLKAPAVAAGGTAGAPGADGRRHASAERFRVPVGDAHTMGSADAAVTIIESSDFQCPFCSRVTPTLDRIRKEYGDRVRVAFKHNPLPFHPRAMAAAEAAEAAGEQGRFWEMHDALFANQRQLGDADLRRYATKIGLDLAQFEAAISGQRHRAKIVADQALVTKMGARGTPGFFINGRLMSGARPFDQFKEVIDEELKVAKALRDRGVAAGAVYAELMKGARTEGLPRGGAGAEAARAPDGPPKRHAFQVGPADPSRGPKDAKVTIIEWLDYECPYCSRAQATLAQIEAEYGDKVRVVVKQLPLDFHRGARPAAKAALAAHEQGKFWQMQTLLFENQRALSRENLTQYATKLGLDLPRFERAVDGPRFDTWLAADQSQATAVGIRGTPNFLINGLELKGAQPLAEFKRVIDAELAAPQE